MSDQLGGYNNPPAGYNPQGGYQQQGGYGTSTIRGSELHAALLATHLNGERLTLDHGYPVRLIAPDRAGVLNTKWVTRVEVR